MTTRCDCGSVMERAVYDGTPYWLCHKCETASKEIEVWSRCVGYLRPTKQWNLGKRQEFKDRRMFKV